ncbi:homoserine kinase [Novosphingobium sediminis]|uniref:Homoserine kinase n=1 Tax=Novosphingobium sediminis TaxID=707214 RepID=A0A512AL78_9SPHN|nr:phosphotransferase [Novosphingobium sediminis]GEO00436.1 homoserine kinase [Novosphingobium sediminis]
MPEIEAYLPAARAALAAFGLPEIEPHPIGKSENVVFRADAPDGTTWALRLHRPGYHALPALESDRALTAHLTAQGLLVPTGRRTVDGAWYAEVPTPDPEATRLAGMTLWHPGQTLADLIGDDRGPETWLWFERTGALLADLHNATAGWTPPAGFTRHHLDAAGLVGEAPFWGRFWDLPCLTADERTLLGKARDLVAARLAALTDPLILIHADAHPANVLISGDALGLIDFDDCAWGWPVFDMAVSLWSASSEPRFPDLQDRFLAGYAARRPLPDSALEQLSLFLLVRTLMLIGWCSDRPEVVGAPEEWKPGLIAKVGAAMDRHL